MSDTTPEGLKWPLRRFLCPDNGLCIAIHPEVWVCWGVPGGFGIAHFLMYYLIESTLVAESRLSYKEHHTEHRLYKQLCRGTIRIHAG